MMLWHHEMAADMSQLLLSADVRSEDDSLARHVITEQRQEQQQLHDWAQQWYGATPRFVRPDRAFLFLRREACMTKVKDPVCGMMIDDENPLATSDYKRKRYYFCSQDCETTFDEIPDEYVE